MNAQLQNTLCKKYSDMFINRGKTADLTCMSRGCECGDGWYNIIDHMCYELNYLQYQYNIQIVFDQIKEKFGLIRVYCTFKPGSEWTLEGIIKNKELHTYKQVTEYIDDIIKKSVDYSCFTCESCGKIGAMLRNGAYIRTLCDECYKKNTPY